MNKLLILKSPSDTPLEIKIVDSIYVPQGNVAIIPEDLGWLDPGQPYRDRIAQLEHELAKAKRGKKYILDSKASM